MQEYSPAFLLLISCLFSLNWYILHRGLNIEVSGEDDRNLNAGYLNIPVLAKIQLLQVYMVQQVRNSGFLLAAKAKHG
jgi:hypothetical protein